MHLVGENAGGYAWGEVDPFKKDHPRICCWAQQILQLDEEVVSSETRREYASAKARGSPLLFFLLLFFYIFFFLPVWLVAADGRSIRCLVNFQADSLDWLAGLEKKLNGSVKRKTTKYFKIDYFCVKNIPLKKRRRRRVILLVWSANGTDLSRRMFLLFVVLVQIYVRVSYDSFLKEPASLIPQET